MQKPSFSCVVLFHSSACCIVHSDWWSGKFTTIRCRCKCHFGKHIANVIRRGSDESGVVVSGDENLHDVKRPRHLRRRRSIVNWLDANSTDDRWWSNFPPRSPAKAYLGRAERCARLRRLWSHGLACVRDKASPNACIACMPIARRRFKVLFSDVASHERPSLDAQLLLLE